MATARESDISLWLHNKLGISSDTWSENGTICTHLNIDLLKNIKDIFVDLATPVKLKLLLSLLHIPKRNLDEWRVELEEIIEVAVVDSEPWVAMLAEILKTYPSAGSLNTEIREPPENQRITHDLITELRKLVKKHSELGLLPKECNYLNRNAFLATAGQQPPLVKHFSLKRKPKAAALRADLINRSSDAQINVKKNQMPTVPVRCRGIPRKLTDTTPLKGIPSRLPGSGLRSSGIGSTPMSRPLMRSGPMRKDGGIKLLDITESPITVQQAKKRRKIQDISDSKAAELEAKQKEDGKHGPPLAPHLPPPEPPQPATPDYAAGLAFSNPATPAPATPGTPLVVATTMATITTRPTASDGRGTPNPAGPAPPTAQRVLISTGGQAGNHAPPTVVYRTVPPSPAYVPSDMIQPTAIPPLIQNISEPLPSMGQPQYATLQPLQPDLVYTTTTIPGLAAAVQPHQIITVTQQPHEARQPQAATAAQPTASQNRTLSLTREQMVEAQEMFRTSNKVTRPEKALILGFMAGSRENPCPHLGNIVTIKLSEGEERVGQPDGSSVGMLAETHFQMNYNTGEWKRIKKYRPMPVEVE